MNQKPHHLIQIATILSTCLAPISVQAQITPDSTLPDNSVVAPDGDVIQIDGGTTRGSNLFHSFQEFSVPAGNEALFNNADAINNIFSRVTGGAESIIDGGVGANGAANVFLINPAGIVFGAGAFLNVGGSFVGSTADSLLFPDGVEYSATDTNVEPILTINAPIGLNFREEPQPITNFSTFDLDNFVGLNVIEDQTIALIGGDIFLDGGFVTTDGGRIELGSVGANNTVSITETEQGFDFGYEGIENFQDINLTFAAFVNSRGADTGDIEVQARNISLIEGSEIFIDTFEGTAGNLIVNATESITISGNAADVDFGFFESAIINNVGENATGEGSVISVSSDRLILNSGGQIGAVNFGNGQGVDIEIDTSEISIGEPFVFDVNDFVFSAISAQTDIGSTGVGGSIRVQTQELAINNGGQITTNTFGSGNGGNLLVNATESIVLNGAIPESISTQLNPSSLLTDIGQEVTATGDGGDLTVNTNRLGIADGAQIGTIARNQGNGGILTINATESININGFSSDAEFRGRGISGLFVSAEPSFEDESGTIITTTGNGGTLNLTTGELIVEDGGAISADTFSLGNGGNVNLNVDRLTVKDGGEIRTGSLIDGDPLDTERGAGGTLNINAAESIEVTGTGDINGDFVNSSLLASGESNGDAGSISLNSNTLSVNNGGLISANTAAGEGGNITLNIDESTRLSEDSLISAAATGFASGGNISIDTAFIVASPDGNNDIVASAGEEGTGGNIDIDAESVFGLETRSQNDATNDIDATGGVDGQVTINTPDTDVTQGIIEVPQNVVEAERTVAQVCNNDGTVGNTFVVQGKGGVPPEPSAPMNSEIILIEGNVAAQPPKAIQTAAGEIMPARGVIKTASGKIILTAYPTVNNRRVPQSQVNCAG